VADFFSNPLKIIDISDFVILYPSSSSSNSINGVIIDELVNINLFSLSTITPEQDNLLFSFSDIKKGLSFINFFSLSFFYFISSYLPLNLYYYNLG
jgi:hypothetical protein